MTTDDLTTISLTSDIFGDSFPTPASIGDVKMYINTYTDPDDNNHVVKVFIPVPEAGEGNYYKVTGADANISENTDEPAILQIIIRNDSNELSNVLYIKTEVSDILDYNGDNKVPVRLYKDDTNGDLIDSIIAQF